ncbi:MAG: hypothetical protein Q9174_005407 [Haloplaca sp. 1 TL-2023]
MHQLIPVDYWGQPLKYRRHALTPKDADQLVKKIAKLSTNPTFQKPLRRKPTPVSDLKIVPAGDSDISAIDVNTLFAPDYGIQNTATDRGDIGKESGRLDSDRLSVTDSHGSSDLYQEHSPTSLPTLFRPGNKRKHTMISEDEDPLCEPMALDVLHPSELKPDEEELATQDSGDQPVCALIQCPLQRSLADLF